MTERPWAVVIAGDEVHTLPSVGGGGHVASIDCPCAPIPVRDAPLDEPVWNHREPAGPVATLARRAK